MDDMLMNLRDQKAFALSAKENELASLNEELARFQDRESQATLIEEMLAAQYAEEQKKHPIDRSLEPEIRRVIKEKGSAVTQALKSCHDANSKARSSYQNSVDRIRVSWSYSYSEREKKEKQEKKALEKKFNDTCKANQKKCVDELKRLFGELDIDVKRFYKAGISRDYLDKLIAIMDKIYKEGSKVGTIPLSYQQKVYKWQQAAKELPVDAEKEIREGEAKERSEMEGKLSSASAAVSDAKKKLAALRRSTTSDEKTLSELTASLAEAEATYGSKKAAIADALSQAKRSTEADFAVKMNSLHSSYEAKEKDRKTKIGKLENELENSKAALGRMIDDKAQLERELSQAFVFSLGKKRDLRSKIEEITASIASAEADVGEKHKALEKQISINLGGKEARETAKINDELKALLEEREIQAAKEIELLDREIAKLKKNVQKLEKSLSDGRKQIKKLEDSIASDSEKIPALEQSLASFHIDYLIKTYGKRFNSSAQVTECKRRISELTAEIKALKKEIAALDKEIAKAEKEKTLREKEQRLALAEKEKELQKIKQAQQEREERIQRELSSQEEEQDAIEAHLKKVTGTVADPEQLTHGTDIKVFLAADTCPLDDAGKKIVTNSIARRKIVQKDATPGCKEYLLYFVDRAGSRVSNFRLLEQKDIGAVTEVTFELKSQDGFSSDDYYLAVTSFEQGALLGFIKYSIRISFANDFDL